MKARTQRREAFSRLLTWVRSRTQLLKPTPGQGSVGWAAPVFLINRLKNLAARYSQSLQSPKTWRPAGMNLRPVFHSLAYHLTNIDVEPRKREIIQARAKCNHRPGPRSVEVIRQWAARAGLQLNLSL